MPLTRIAIPLICLAGVLSAAPATQGPDRADANLATVKQYCAGCHNDKAKIGGDEAQSGLIVKQARALGIDCSGPYSGDTIFVRALRGEFDLIVAMYHDQGHIPMKLIDFEGGVNVSLGLPIIRTSVDHGTAFDIAGRNHADATNMKAAMRLAVRMAEGKLALASNSAGLSTPDPAHTGGSR